MPRLPRCAFLLVFLFIPVFPAGAATVSFSLLPDPWVVDSEFDLQVNLTNCSGCGNSYLRGVFYSSGTNYFGLTQNQLGEWVGTSSDKTKYFEILKEDLIAGSWSGRIKFKADSISEYFSGPGHYNFKIGRYTSASGSASRSATSSANIALLTPTLFVLIPTPTPTPVSTVTPTPEIDKPSSKFLLKFPKLPRLPILASIYLFFA
jgi:hypothetical protein